ncbi:uncharacterized protein A4U43_C04F27180 [Asparagus officinalis]|uniref:Uncharacterized protein n=1 Tax=Asparagus officinalis TaxID=4686 RepID=A0A5P1F8L8_ASPOF|nr:uncharacterized protein A4U43_C04F27180 [Asparagus officinalis]
MPDGGNVALLQRYERSKWLNNYIVEVRRILQNKDHYRLYCCFPSIDGVSPGDEFEDGMSSERFTCLPIGCFNWLVYIRPGHLVARLNGMEYFCSEFELCMARSLHGVIVFRSEAQTSLC